jgi:hypothetical protein
MDGGAVALPGEHPGLADDGLGFFMAQKAKPDFRRQEHDLSGAGSTIGQIL